MAKQWFAVHCRPNYEKKASESLIATLKREGLDDQMGEEIFIPKQKVTTKGRTSLQSLMPGYIFINVEMTDEIWYLIRENRNTTGVVGTNKPSPIPADQIDSLKKKAAIPTSTEKIISETFRVGDEVSITAGPFDSFAGVIEGINGDNLNVIVTVFGRPTEVELSHSQVERILT